MKKIKVIVIAPRRSVAKGYKPSFEIYNMRWIFHAYDDDFFPSVPHGHSVEGKYKLNIYTGEIYNINKKVIGAANSKQINKLLQQPKFQDLIATAVEYYNSLKPRTPANYKKRVTYNHIVHKRAAGVGILSQNKRVIKKNIILQRKPSINIINHHTSKVLTTIEVTIPIRLYQ